MKIKIPKPYWVIGTLTAASIIVVGGYNIIVANTNEKNINVQQIDYSNDIKELRQRLEKAEEEIEILKEKSASVESDNKDKDQTINDLQAKVNSLNNTSNIQGISKQLQNITIKDNKQKELIKEKEELEKEYKVYLDKIYKRNELEIKKRELEAERESLKSEINYLNTSPYIDVNEANKYIEELTSKANSSTSDKEKQECMNEIVRLKQLIKTYEENKIKLENLERQLADLQKTIQEKDFDNQISKVTLSKEENERYEEILPRIGKINEELLKY